MVLPLIGSFLASSFLPGMTGMSTLAAGALGSGIGSLLQGDSLEDAVTTGFTSFLGGKLLGGLGAAGKGGEALKDTASSSAMAAKAPDVLGQAMQTTPATQGIFGTPTMTTVADPVNLMNRPEGLGLFDAAKLGLKQGAANVMANPMAAAGSALGTQVGQALTAPLLSNKLNELTDRISNGKEFHNSGPMFSKALSPNLIFELLPLTRDSLTDFL